MKSYKLSIIIPHYNSSDLLEKLLSTIPKDQNIEVIVIDDKSENKHIEYINSLNISEKYIDFLFLKNETLKKGAGVARNIGLDYARGEWILFADADDYFSDNFYERVSQYFGSDNEVVFFRPTSIYIDTGEVADRHMNFTKCLDNYVKYTNKESELKLRYNIPNPVCKLIKKDFLERNNIKFEEVIVSDDVMFSTKVGYFMTKFDISDSTIYIITRSHGSLTVNLSEQMFDVRFQTYIDRYHFLKAKLEKDGLDSLKIIFIVWLFDSLNYGIRKFFNTYQVLKREKLKIIDSRMFNIFFIIKQVFNRIKYVNNHKRFFIKD